MLSTQRLAKDHFEIDQMREAVTATARGFEAVIADLPDAVRRKGAVSAGWRASSG